MKDSAFASGPLVGLVTIVVTSLLLVASAKALWLVYAGITLICVVALKLAGMNWLDAICHAFSAMSLGGFSTHDASLGFFASPLIDFIAIVFMAWRPGAQPLRHVSSPPGPAVLWPIGRPLPGPVRRLSASVRGAAARPGGEPRRVRQAGQFAEAAYWLGLEPIETVPAGAPVAWPLLALGLGLYLVHFLG